MSNPTTPFSWQMPTATDLVTDLPADFEVFGQAVATSMADLLGGTSGQILSKNSNTDMDFVWIANDQGDITAVTAGTGISGGGTSGAVTVTNSMATTIDAKGDLVPGTGADTFARLAVGANGTILTADSAEATGLKYAGNWVTFTPSSIGGFTLGNGTINARYCRVGKVTFIYFEFNLGSTSAVTGEVTFQIPAAAGTIGGKNQNGIVTYLDAGTAAYLGSIETTIGGGTLYLRVGNSAGTYLTNSNQSSTVPFTWTNGDSFVGYLWYEVQ